MAEASFVVIPVEGLRVAANPAQIRAIKEARCPVVSVDFITQCLKEQATRRFQALLVFNTPSR